MKGIVFNLFEQVVVAEHGEAAWDELLDTAGLDGTYTSLGSYADREMMGLVAAAAASFSLEPNDVLRWFGRRSMALLAQSYPDFFTPHRTTLPFVLSVNSIIHPEVRKLYAGAQCPNFDFEEAADGTLLMGYRSERQLCALAQGFIEGAGDYYREAVEVDHRQCIQHGDPRCLLAIRAFAPAAA
jgi:hypothetical protein